MLVITFHNISNLAPVSDYNYEVWITTIDGSKKILANGRIEEHLRSDGWQTLVRRLLSKV